MKRTVITVDGNGMLSIPSNLENLRMSEGELVNMLHVTAPKLNSVIRAIYKEGMLLMSKVQQRQELSKGIWQTLYGFPMIVAICFRLVSNGAAHLQEAIRSKRENIHCPATLWRDQFLQRRIVVSLRHRLFTVVLTCWRTDSLSYNVIKKYTCKEACKHKCIPACHTFYMFIV